MKRVVTGFFLITLLITIPVLSQETITLTTYYPSPFGVYSQLATDTLGVGDNNSSGGIDANDAPDHAIAG